MDNFAANNYLGPVGGANAIIKSKRKYFLNLTSNCYHLLGFTQNQDNLVVVRPQTPEQKIKTCLNCGNMEDFIKGL